MAPNALNRKMIAELLERIKDWPEGALRTVKEAIEQMLAKPAQPQQRHPSSDDAFGTWEGPETAAEISAMIREGRSQNPERDML